MNKSISFAKLDFITVKPYLTIKNLFLILLVSGVMGYTGSISSLIGIVMVYGAIFVSYPFSVGDKNGIDMLYSTLTLKRSNVVKGRYIFSLILNLGISAFAFVCSFAVMTIFNNDFNIQETLFTILTCFLIFTTVQAIQLPLYFKLGYNKAKFLVYIPLAAFPLAVIFITSLLEKKILYVNLATIINWVTANPEIVFAAAIVLWAVICTVSCRLSCCFYKKREF